MTADKNPGSASPYRAPGMVDVTDLEIARIKEDGETKRAVEAMRLKAKAESRDAWFEWYRKSDAPSGVIGFTIVAMVLTACAITVMSAVHAWWGHG